MDDAPLDPAAAGWSLLRASGFPDHVGPLWLRRGGELPRFAMLADERHTNVHGIVHGGMIMTFADTGLGITVWEAMGRQPCVTIQFAVQFLDAVRPGDFVELDAEVLRRSASVVFVRGTLRCGERRVASVDGVWKMIRARTQPGERDTAREMN